MNFWQLTLNRGYGESNGNRRPFSWNACNVDRPIMGLDDIMNDTHAHSQAVDGIVGGVGAVKFIKHLRDLFFGHANTLVFDVE